MTRSRELPPELQQSKGWENFQASQGFIEDGFPFCEGFPKTHLDRQYSIITRDGERLTAVVDPTTQYRAEGLTWRTMDGDMVKEQVVVAWIEQKS